MSSPDPLRSDGLPFVFSSFKLDGRIVSWTTKISSNGQPALMAPGFTPRDESDVIPLVRDVMTYATR